MKKVFLMIGLIGSLMQAGDKKGPQKKKGFDTTLVSISFPQLINNNHTPYFQISQYMEKILPNIRRLIDKEGRVQLATQVDPKKIQTLLENYADKNILGVSEIMTNLSPQEFGDISTNVCTPLGIQICGKLPTIYNPKTAVNDAVAGGNADDYLSFIVKTTTGDVQWKERCGFICLPKALIQPSIVKSAMNNNIVSINLNKEKTEQQAHTLLALVGAYVKAHADTNPAIRIPLLKQICDNVPAVLIHEFKNNIVRLLGLSDEQIIGFENSILHASAKTAWQYTRDCLAVCGLLAVIITGWNKLRS